MNLIYTKTGKEVKIGDIATTFRDQKVVVVYFAEPHKITSSGKVTCRPVDSKDSEEFFVGVIGAEWIDELPDKILNDFVVIGQNVYGKANNIYDAVKNASSVDVKINRFLVYLVSEDYQISMIDGSVTASTVHTIGWFNKSGQALRGKA